MDHIRILRRALNITWVYRALWVFGILLALTIPQGRTGGSNGGGGNNGGGSGIVPPVPPAIPSIPQNAINTAIGILIAVLCVVLILVILFTILRYVSETALIRMVNLYEDTGEQVSVRQGFRFGWSRASLRLFLIDLIFGLGTFVVFILLLLVALAPLLLWLTRNQTLGILGTVVAVGMAMLLIFLTILVAAALSILRQFFKRAVVLEDRGVFDAIRRGFSLVRSRLGDVVIMGLILFGIGLLLTIVMIPVFILIVLVAVVIGGLPALLAAFITGLFAQGSLPWVVAAVIGVPIFILVAALPLLFIEGLVQTYTSTTWTLTFREVLALGAAGSTPAPLPPLEPAPDEPAPDEPDITQ